MDGWETRRKRTGGHDWTIIALAKPSIIEGVLLDTTFFTGNYAPRFSIQAARLKFKGTLIYTNLIKYGDVISFVISVDVSRLLLEYEN